VDTLLEKLVTNGCPRCNAGDLLIESQVAEEDDAVGAVVRCDFDQMREALDWNRRRRSLLAISDDEDSTSRSARGE
jgi:hypothetical protein